MTPDWLPDELELLGMSINDDYIKLFAIFERDFINANVVVVDGDEVIYDTSLDPVTDGKYPRGFTHLVTKGETERVIDYDRARKLPWVRSVLENYNELGVISFWVAQSKAESLYLWLQDYDFIVVLRRLKSEKCQNAKKIIVTAFHVYGRKSRHRYQKLLDRATKVL
jgi:hypothetical protein